MAAAAALAFTGKSVATATISFWLNKAFTCLTEYCKVEGLEDVKNRVLKSMNKVKAVLKVVDTENIREKSTDLMHGCGTSGMQSRRPRTRSTSLSTTSAARRQMITRLVTGAPLFQR